MKPPRFTDEMVTEYMEKGYWDNLTFAEIWDRNAEKYPEKEAIVDSKTRITWSKAKQLIDRLALGLMELIQRDRVLVIQLPNCTELVLLYVACQKVGIIHMEALINLQHREIEHMLRVVEAEGIVIPWKFRNFDHFAMVEEIRPSLPHLKHVFVADDEVPEGAISIAEMMYQPLEARYPLGRVHERRFEATEVIGLRHTSGTTGFPKIVEQVMCVRVLLAKELVRAFKLTSDDVVAAVTPVSGGPGQPALIAAPMLGAKIVLMERFDTEGFFKLIEREKVTVAGVVPTILDRIVRHPSLSKYDLGSLRAINCSGSPLTCSLAQEAEEKLNCPIFQRYGIQDIGSLTSSSVDDPQNARHTTVGKPLKGSEIKIVDEAGREVPKEEVGEIILRGALAVSGYYEDVERTRQTWDAHGWARTGDLGRFDEQGNLRIIGRVKDIIIRGGQNIDPVEVEDVLRIYPKVSAVAVVGIPDPIMGERVCAYVVPKPGKTFTFEEVISFLKEKRVAPFKLPERLEVIDKLPLVADQKVDKKALKQDIASKLTLEKGSTR